MDEFTTGFAGGLLVGGALLLIALVQVGTDDYSGKRIGECRQAATFLNHQSNPMVHKWYMDNCSHLEAG